MQVSDSEHEIFGPRGWFREKLDDVIDQFGSTACLEEQHLFGITDASPVTRVAAARICHSGGPGGEACPMLETCATANIATKYETVWGGYYKGEPVERLTPEEIRKWVHKTVKAVHKAKGGAAELLAEFRLGIPTLDSVIDAEVGLDNIELNGECLSLVDPDPYRAIILRRHITEQAIMLGMQSRGMARIELLCRNSATCISPWHMLWSVEPLDNALFAITPSQQVALALHLVFSKGWDYRNALEMLPDLDEAGLIALTSVASWLQYLGEDFTRFGTASDILQWAEMSVLEPMNGLQQAAALKLVRAAEELSCENVSQLIRVGEELY